jgi:molybdenum cofactor cytidylyltransferase
VIFGTLPVGDAEGTILAHSVRIGEGAIQKGTRLTAEHIAALRAAGADAVVVARLEAGDVGENEAAYRVAMAIAGDGLEVGPEDIAGLGVGGLLGEITARPQLREGKAPEPAHQPRIAAVILAAGQSKRMLGVNKLIANVRGRPLVRSAAEAALASRARPVLVVTGHRAQDVRAALAGLDVAYVDNPRYAEGLATSLRSGIEGLPPDVDGAVVLLADMPGVDAALINRLIAAYDPVRGAEIVVPTHDRKRGNPVLWSARFFGELRAIKGDVGGKHLLGEHADAVVELELGPAVAWDIDTPEEMVAARGG